MLFKEYRFYLNLKIAFQVKIWFQNRRTKWKKQENISNAEAAELMKSKGGIKQEMESPKPKLTSSDLLQSHHSSSSCSSGSPIQNGIGSMMVNTIYLGDGIRRLSYS